MVVITDFQPDDVERMVEIAPNAFGVWARYGLDRTLPRDRVEHLYREEARAYAAKATAEEADFAVFVRHSSIGPTVQRIYSGNDLAEAEATALAARNSLRSGGSLPSSSER